MRRNEIVMGKWQYKILALVLCLGCSVALPIKAEDTESKVGADDSSSAPARSGVLTGLGESALSRAHPDESVWLTIDKDDQVLGLLFSERALPVKGALMILPEVGETAASGVAGALAQRLADKGWAVLTVGLEAPSSSLRAQLERGADSPKEASESDTIVSQEVDIRVDEPPEKPEGIYRERIQKTLQAGLTTLVKRGYESPALLAIGRAGNYIVDLPSAGQHARAIIWVAPVFYPRDKATLGNHLKASSVQAVLELYDSRATNQVSINQREVMLYKAGITGYERQPVALHQPPSIQDAQALANRIDAWLLSR